jgi:hypothetical protein
MKLKLSALFAAALALGSLPAFAGTVNILWYTGGVTSSGGTAGSSYTNAIMNLAGQENSVFNTASINTWNVTFWDSGAMPTGPFNVLVGASPQGGWNSYPDYSPTSALMASPGANSAADYGRVMLTGQDADWHYQFGPGPANFDGPAGFLIDAINWAGSGTGMGGVFLGSTGNGIFSGIGTDSGSDNTVVIPGAYSAFPINVGLTSAGLSNWGTSAHTSFNGYDTTQWAGINVGPDLGLDAHDNAISITLVTAESAGGGTGGSVPDAASTALLTLFGLSLLIITQRFMGVRAALNQLL